MQKIKPAAAGSSDADAALEGVLQACGIVRALHHAAAQGLQDMPAIAPLLY